jgi:hypothetical protein
MFRSAIAALATATLLSAPARADEISDTIQSALDAYNAGDIKYATEELVFAQQQLQSLKADGLQAFLPEAADGWTRTVSTEMNAGMAMMGGTGVEATYVGPDQNFTLSITADSPMVSSFAAMFGNSAMMGAMGKITRVGREKFVDQDGSLTGVMDGRILIQASGAPIDVMVSTLATMDFAKLASFGK